MVREDTGGGETQRQRRQEAEMVIAVLRETLNSALGYGLRANR